MSNECLEEIPGVEEVSPVRIFVEEETATASRVTRGYHTLKRLKVESNSYGNIISDGVSKAENDVFSKLEKGVRYYGGNVAVVISRHLSGVARAQINILADVYNIDPFPQV